MIYAIGRAILEYFDLFGLKNHRVEWKHVNSQIKLLLCF